MRVLVTGVGGQDGPYLCKYLLDQGHQVFGMHRRDANNSFPGLTFLGIERNINYVECDLLEYECVRSIVKEIRPDRIYNLAAQSHVHTSFNLPVYTLSVNTLGVLHILESIRALDKSCRFYQASTSEQFGINNTEKQNEETPFYPRSPYGVSKLAAYWLVRNYREAYGLHASNGILYNHESPIRGDNFVTRKITKGLAERWMDLSLPAIKLGNISARRDWGHAADYVRAMALIMEQEKPDDYVVATGKTISVKQFLELCVKWFAENATGCEDWIDSTWNGDLKPGSVYGTAEQSLVFIDEKLYRPSEVPYLCGDASKIMKLGWKPEINIDGLVADMCRHDMHMALL